MADPSVEELLERLKKSLVAATALLGETPANWENKCEDAFSKFRLTVVHLRKERAALDTIEDKNGAWRFICKFGKTRPFLHDRCNEVLKILMTSDLWMQAFAQAGFRPNDLPPAVADEFDKRLREAIPDDELPPVPPPRERPAELARGDAGPSVSTVFRPANMAVVVQRCTTAKILVDERMQMWGEIGRGLVISVSFSKGATQDAVQHAARFLLTARLSMRSERARASASSAESVVSLCKAGEEQGILLMPQASLCSELGKDNIGLQYSHGCPETQASALYKAFIAAFRSSAAELIGTAAPAKELRVVACNFSGRQSMEMTSDGPFMHAFNF
mmetsp:Transcript_47332/g.135711  ORF Transcript_47332/g.135711 Transcript_47332/m.135711 type:complete len:332 (+) Transcript_47332:113-1108(+)